MELITSVIQIRSRVWISLESGEKYWLGPQAARELGWQAGMEIDRDELRKTILLRQYPHAINLAVAMLARRDCSRGEIEQKLKSARYMDEAIEMALYKLEKENLLDDRTFALQWASSRLNRSYGARRIEQELKAKGVSREDADAALKHIDPQQQLAQAISLATKGFNRAKAGEDPRKTSQRVLNMLVRRGYDWETARKACNTARSGTEPDDE